MTLRDRDRDGDHGLSCDPNLLYTVLELQKVGKVARIVANNTIFCNFT